MDAAAAAFQPCLVLLRPCSLERVRIVGYQSNFISCQLELYATGLFLAEPEEYDELSAEQVRCETLCML